MLRKREWKLLVVQQCDIIALHYVLLLNKKASIATFLFDPSAIQLWYLIAFPLSIYLLLAALLLMLRALTFVCSSSLSIFLTLSLSCALSRSLFVVGVFLLAAGNRCCAIQLILHEKWKLLLNVLYFGWYFHVEFTYVHCSHVVLWLVLVYLIRFCYFYSLFIYRIEKWQWFLV